MLYLIRKQENVEQNNKCCNGSERVNLQGVLKLKYTKILNLDET